MIIFDKLGEFNINPDVIRTLVVHDSKISSRINSRSIEYSYTNNYDNSYVMKMFSNEKVLWEWSGGPMEEHFFCILYYIVVKSFDRKVLFLGSVSGGFIAILDYETGIDLEWDSGNSEISEFLHFLERLFIKGGMFSPYQNIYSVPCSISSDTVLDKLDDSSYGINHIFLI